ncbi:efflux RND transporter permease subunit [Anaerofilum sp. BX8]|uniref:Efflux RND transporter permease subunit n=1 Tax=Anaerofilum hominis TaxID=2763016 RepID=A0A923L1G0_9FIRM|nr:efflux RND transporter permease subunit [Anaerofilum hominis]MBC5581213.1 efflux RND transporter permease subunit [Anaerofilum hominis]
MLPKLSVKKPYTILVAVVLVLVLGVVSFTGMTTDLLPNIELPYVVVVTTYPGASPEKVELAVTRPLESVLGTTSGLSHVSSVSQENSSMIILEFEQGTNMDSAMIELSGNVDLVKAQLDDAVGAPMLMKISPDMLPVMVASVDADGMDAKALSRLVDDTVVPAFERLDGVASVSGTGLLEEKLQVTLDQDKIDALNDKVLASVDEKLAEAQGELNSGRAKIADGRAKLESAKSELASKKQSGVDELAAASAKVDGVVANLSALLAEEATLTANQKAFEAEKAGYAQAWEQLKGTYSALEKIIKDLSQTASQMGAKIPDSIAGLAALDENEYNNTVLPVITPFIEAVAPDQAAAFSYANICALQKGYMDIERRLPEIETELSNITTRMAVIAQMKPQLQQGLDEATKGYQQLESGKMTAVNELTKGEVTITTTEQSLDEAEQQLKDAQKQFEEARDAAYEKADLHGILTPELISNILMAQNFSMPAGYLSGEDSQTLVKVGDAYSAEGELADTLLFHIDAEGVGDIRLSDVAQVELVDNSGETYAKVNGNDGILLSFQKQSTASTTAVADRIEKEIAVLMAENEGLHVTPLMNQGDYIHLIIDSVLQNLVIGGLLAILVLIFFLKDAKPTLIIACSIPISLLFAITLMYFTGVTLNIISLSGLALGVGMLVDNSIVVIENIYRMRSEGVPAHRAAVAGANQVAGAIFASTLTTVCVFLPIVFTQGISRELFTDMGLTIGYSLMASLLVALTLVPALGSTVLRTTVEKKHPWFDALVRGYEKLLRFSLAHKAPVLIAAVALLGLACYGAATMGTAFIPAMDSPQMSATLELPKGADSHTLYETTDKVVERMLAVEGVETVGAMEGGGMMGGGSSGGMSFYILLGDDPGATNAEIAQQLRDAVADLDCTLEVSASTMDMSALGGSGIEVELKGRDLDQLKAAADEVAALVRDTEGAVEVSAGSGEADPELRVTVDRDKAMRKGMTTAQVYAELASALKTETSATTLTQGQNDYPVIVVDGADALTRGSLAGYTFTVTNAEGEEESFPLSDIADVSEQPGVSAIRRDAGSRYMTVSAGIDADHNVGLVSRELEKKLADYQPPAGITVELQGESETINSAMGDLVKMILLAVVFIYLIMVAQFQSLLSPFIVLFTLPLAFTGGLLLLWITGKELSIIAMLGFLVLAGVVVNNGIVFVDYANQLRLAGREKREALVETGRTRIRPILMTALTTILAMGTMALGLGDGAEMTQPMAIVTIGGLTYATLLTLLVVPVMYDLFSRRDLKPIDIEEA